MERSEVIQQAAERVWKEHQLRGGTIRRTTSPQGLINLLASVAETLYELTVADDPCMLGTNIEGEVNREEGTILYRPDLDAARAAFVIAHEIGHVALNHPAMEIGADTAEQIDTELRPDDLSVARAQLTTGLDLSEAMLSGLRGYSPRDRWEREANAFASELLTPASALRELRRADPSITVEQMASQLAVPVSLVHRGMVSTFLTARLDQPTEELSDASEAAPTTLDASQERAASVQAPARIIAGPGAGKTRVLVERFARLVNAGDDPRRILALTFANKAAGEMRERLTKLVDPSLAGAVDVATFHAFGLQLLQEYGQHLGLQQPVRLLTPLDALLLLRPHLAKMPLGSFAELNLLIKNVRDLLKAISRAKDENALPEDWLEKASTPQEQDAGKFYADYQRILSENSCLDYADLITETLKLLALPEVAKEIQERYDHILVDEFQDINYSSGRLVRELDGGKGIVWAVGDPKQSIYGFRGASPINLGKFTAPEYYPEAQTIHLDGNYRSVADIVMAGQAVPITLPGDPAILAPALRAHRGQPSAEPAVSHFTYPHSKDEFVGIAQQIAQLATAGTQLSSIAVLCSKNSQAQAIADALSAKGIAHTWGGPLENRAIFKTVMSALLLAIDDPRGIVGLTTIDPLADVAPGGVLELPEADRRALFSVHRRYRRGKKPSARLLLEAAVRGEIPGLSTQGNTTCGALLQMTEKLSTTARAHHNLAIYIFECAAWFGVLTHSEVSDSVGARRTRATLGQIFDLAAAFVQRQPKEGDVSTAAFLEYIRAAIESGGLDTPKDLSPGGQAVSILTAHRSKGLEWPIVFVPCLTTEQFEGKDTDEAVALPVGLIHDLEEEGEARQARESACLFYVAVTRAKDRLVLSHSQKYANNRKGTPMQPLIALTEQLRSRGRLHEEAGSGSAGEEAEEIPNDPMNVGIAMGAVFQERHLSAYDDCPRKYLLGSVYGLDGEERALLDYHRVISGVLDDLDAGGSSWQEALAKRWKADGPSSDHWQEPFLKQAAERLLSKGTSKSGKRSQKGQVSIGATSDGQERCIEFGIDAEFRTEEGKRVFCRNKLTGRPPKDDEPVRDQKTVLHGLFAEQQADEPAHAIVRFAEHDVEQVVDITTRLRNDRLKKYRQIIEGIEVGQLSPKPGSDCKYCSFRLVCNAAKSS